MYADRRMRKDFIAGVLALGAVSAWAGWSWWSGGIIDILVDVNQPAEEKIDAFREYFESWGPLAPLVYMGIVVVEAVVAPLPGAMLYLPGGVLFGGFWGGTLSLAGNIIGAGACAVLVRTLLGERWSQNFFESARLETARRIILDHGILSVALLRVNPLTSSDLVSYAAGLTPLSVTRIMLGTGIGMTPLAYAQAYFSVGLFAMFPWLVWPLVVGCVLYLIVAVVLVVRLSAPRPAPAVEEP
jgi:uncharacterized membrane protein YdjX (TVP38/TMEM64 family)